MSSQIATNLTRYAASQHLPRVLIWNQTRSKIEYLAQEVHCEVVLSLDEMAQRCDVIHTCLANDEVALGVYQQFLDALAAGSSTIFVDHSTFFPTTSSVL